MLSDKEPPELMSDKAALLWVSWLAGLAANLEVTILSHQIRPEIIEMALKRYQELALELDEMDEDALNCAMAIGKAVAVIGHLGLRRVREGFEQMEAELEEILSDGE